MIIALVLPKTPVSDYLPALFMGPFSFSHHNNLNCLNSIKHADTSFKRLIGNLFSYYLNVRNY